MDKLLDKTIGILLYILFAFPLFKTGTINTILIIVFLCSIVLFFKNRENTIPLKKIFLLSFPFWMIGVNAVSYFVEDQWYEPVQNALVFFIYPLAFSFIPQRFFSNEKIAHYLLVLKISCVVVSVGFVFLFLNKYTASDFFKMDYRISKFRDFVYNEIPYFKIHPSYFTLLTVYLTSSCLENIFKNKRYYEVMFIVIYVLITLFLLTKLSLILLFLLFAYYFLFKWSLKNRLKTVFVIVFLGLFVFAVYKVPGIYDRFYEIYLSINVAPKGVAHDSTNVRMAVYKCDCEILYQNFFKGVGFHNISYEINECFSNKYVSDFYKNKDFMSHNYYLYMFLGAGVFGFLLFCIYWFNMAKIVFSLKIFELSVFFILISVACTMEDFLFRNFGSIFYHFILLAYLKNKKVI